MPTADPTTLTAVTIGETFSQTITVESTGIEVITSVNASLAGSPLEPQILISIDTNNITISGRHLNTFSDVFTYLEPGQSDLTSVPTVVVGAGNVPPDKNLFNLNQDTRQSATRTYNINVVTDIGSSLLTVTQAVSNPLEAIRSFMDNYNYKAS